MNRKYIVTGTVLTIMIVVAKLNYDVSGACSNDYVSQSSVPGVAPKPSDPVKQTDCLGAVLDPTWSDGKCPGEVASATRNCQLSPVMKDYVQKTYELRYESIGGSHPYPICSLKTTTNLTVSVECVTIVECPKATPAPPGG